MTTPELEDRVRSMLQLAKVPEKPAYTTSEAAAVLGVSSNTVLAMCNRWEPPSADGGRRDGLECYRIGLRRDRRIPHHAICEYLAANNEYEREMSA